MFYEAAIYRYLTSIFLVDVEPISGCISIYELDDRFFIAMIVSFNGFVVVSNKLRVCECDCIRELDAIRAARSLLISTALYRMICVIPQKRKSVVILYAYSKIHGWCISELYIFWNNGGKTIACSIMWKHASQWQFIGSMPKSAVGSCFS